ncbi:tRNA 2-selenouridine(34) synthase MnmH [Roseibacterium sp. SDUM158017]|uniref:tRNA 2-selenouridine(34) synthase MnmH n=1 Tax=Roseicyclus salinarum TaxID=3036773 RepID=UPI0024156EB3|nr:tRNA 2-selenouridine(34) synthase MnmH [Roseibacterium sp. SDUM158017]MDG4647383.1 tRNA 2-selenouridine(34) synthase MnmH [Roseibacterium sp. SDUM158017]
MPFVLTDSAALRQAEFDTIIDVRSPSEFAEDHVPGAVSMPVLSDAERAEVGTIYTQDSPFRARKIGAAMVARNAARHIEEGLMDRDGGWRPLVYCWRGGQRSGSFAAILGQIGWRVQTLEGGYRSWRRLVVGRLYDVDLKLRVVRLDGYTGTAKTALLAEIAALGGQVIDLEGLARHRGSILGDVDGEQPAQKGFETALVQALDAMDPARPVLVEAESARIGRLRIPPALWVAMRGSPRIVVEAPVEARARFLAGEYAGLAADAPALTARLDGLRAIAGHETVDGWLAMLGEGRLEDLSEALIRQHYDPAYGRLRRSDEGRVVARVELEALDAGARAAAARRIMEHLSGMARNAA